ncbi:alpha-1,2-fucosyltransferase [Spirosoma panaciterrae]|uniref:alpha-1,2-fucosyltransferase n=1 Tax=Spirosoma panaciterrae TaxID=496058 RepID=UPI0003682422|nr:alpha-1,2-fucosyltransferase [Spirosoma panaciterrae]
MNRRVAVQLKGGLGNQLFQYALGRRLSLQLEAELLFDCSVLENRIPVTNFTFRSFDLDMFRIAGRVATPSDLPLFPKSASIRSPWPHLVQLARLWKQGYSYVYERGFAYNPKMLRQLSDRVYLNGYWQSYRYFEDIAATLRADCSFPDPLPDSAVGLAGQINATNSICLHIRRTDFLQVPLHQVSNADYVGRAIAYMAERVNDPHFFVFSDDIAWCQTNLRLSYPVVFVPNELAGPKNSLHFRLMRYCKHFITANSTFSWWAAWLSEPSDGKVIVTPQTWFSDSRSIDDLIPANWIRL